MSELVVDLATALSWPAFGVLAVFLFRKPLAQFFDAVRARATKFSVLNVGVELTSGIAAAPIPLLEDIQCAPSSTQISDSARAMPEQVQETRLLISLSSISAAAKSG